MGQRNGVGGIGLRCFVKKVLLKILLNLQEICWSLLLNKVAGSKPTNLLSEIPAKVFCYKFCEILKNTFFVERLRTFITMFCLPRPKPQFQSIGNFSFPNQIPFSFTKQTLVKVLG